MGSTRGPARSISGLADDCRGRGHRPQANRELAVQAVNAECEIVGFRYIRRPRFGICKISVMHEDHGSLSRRDPDLSLRPPWGGFRLDMSAPSIQAASHIPQSGSPARGLAGRTRNKILNLLPAKELDAILERSELVTIKSEEVIFRRHEPIRYAYFPDNCVISLVTEMSDGDSVEAMTIGNDGFVGLAVFHEVPSSWLKAIGQISGETRRVATKDWELVLANGHFELHALTTHSSLKTRLRFALCSHAMLLRSEQRLRP